MSYITCPHSSIILVDSKGDAVISESFDHLTDTQLAQNVDWDKFNDIFKEGSYGDQTRHV